MLLFLYKTGKIDLEKLVCDENVEIFKVFCDIKLSSYKIQPERLFITACKKGQIKFAKWIHSKYNNLDIHLDNESAFYWASLNGHIDIAEWILTLDDLYFVDNIKYIFCRACESGNIAVAKWLKKNYNIDVHELDDYSFRWAAFYGHLDILQWLYSLDNNILLDYLQDALISSCTKGHLNMAKWIISLNKILNIYPIANFDRCCNSGNIEMVKWFYELNKDSIKDVYQGWNGLFCCICGHGYTDIAKYLLEINENIDINYFGNKAFIMSCKNGHIDLAKWLFSLKNNTLMYKEAFVLSCGNGFIDIAKWLIESTDITIDTDTCQLSFDAACKNGYLYVVIWIFELAKNANLFIDIHKDNEGAFRACCKSGYYELLLYLYDKDSSINITINDHEGFLTACKNKHVEIAEWLTTKCHEYCVVVKNGVINKYRINNELSIALDILNSDDLDKYTDIFKLLGITETNRYFDGEDNNRNCVICGDYKERMIKTECRHVYCLECLLHWFITVNLKKDFKCAYCRTVFNWKNCSDYSLSQ